eukprot:1552983-Prymnesium_polylepis.1
MCSRPLVRERAAVAVVQIRHGRRVLHDHPRPRRQQRAIERCGDADAVAHLVLLVCKASGQVAGEHGRLRPPLHGYTRAEHCAVPLRLTVHARYTLRSGGPHARCTHDRYLAGTISWVQPPSLSVSDAMKHAGDIFHSVVRKFLRTFIDTTGHARRHGAPSGQAGTYPL